MNYTVCDFEQNTSIMQNLPTDALHDAMSDVHLYSHMASSESILDIGNLSYPPDISFSATCVVFCLLAPCWSPGHKNTKVKYVFA